MSPVYQYAPPRPNQYAGSIADLMLHQGDIAARGAELIGQAQSNAALQSGQAWAGAAQNITNAGVGALQQVADPRMQLARQEVESNKRALAYQQTAAKVAQGLVGPNGEQPSPDTASSMLTQAGVPVTYQKPILDSLTSMDHYHKEAMADAGHIAYRLVTSLPDGATDEDRAHAAAAGLGAAQAQGIVTPGASQKIIGALGQGADPKGLALSFMGISPSGRYKDVIQDETKPTSVGRGGLYIPGQGIVGGTPPNKPNPNVAALALDAAGGDPQQALEKLKEQQKAPTKKSLESKPVLLNGKRTFVNYDPDSGKSTLPSGEDVSDQVAPIPPESVNQQSQLGWKIQQGTGPDGKPVWVRINERNGKVEPVDSAALRPKLGATLESRVASAQAVSQTGNDIIQKLSNPAYANVVGPAMGRLGKVRDWIGNPPPELSELAGLIESYSLANMGVHGMRSAQGAEMIKQLLDTKHTPASLIASIKGLQGFSSHFIQNEGIQPATGQAATPAAGNTYKLVNGQWVKQ